MVKPGAVGLRLPAAKAVLAGVAALLGLALRALLAVLVGLAMLVGLVVLAVLVLMGLTGPLPAAVVALRGRIFERGGWNRRDLGACEAGRRRSLPSGLRASGRHRP